MTTSQPISEGREEGFKELDDVNHLAGKTLVTIQDDHANVFAYTTATPYTKEAVNTLKPESLQSTLIYNSFKLNMDGKLIGLETT